MSLTSCLNRFSSSLDVRDLMNQSKRKFHDRCTCQLISIYYTRNNIFHVLPTSMSHKNKTYLRKQTSFDSLCIHCTVQICHLWQHTNEKFGDLSRYSVMLYVGTFGTSFKSVSFLITPTFPRWFRKYVTVLWHPPGLRSFGLIPLSSDSTSPAWHRVLTKAKRVNMLDKLKPFMWPYLLMKSRCNSNSRVESLL